MHHFESNITFPQWALHFNEVREACVYYVKNCGATLSVDPILVFVKNDDTWEVDENVGDDFPADHVILGGDNTVAVHAISKDGEMSHIRSVLNLYAVPYDHEGLGRKVGDGLVDENIYVRFDEKLKCRVKAISNQGESVSPPLSMIKRMAEENDCAGIIAAINTFNIATRPDSAILDGGPTPDNLPLFLFIRSVHAGDADSAAALLEDRQFDLSAIDDAERMRLLISLHQSWGNTTMLELCVDNDLQIQASDIEDLRALFPLVENKELAFFDGLQAVLASQAIKKVFKQIVGNEQNNAP